MQDENYDQFLICVSPRNHFDSIQYVTTIILTARHAHVTPNMQWTLVNMMHCKNKQNKTYHRGCVAIALKRIPLRPRLYETDSHYSRVSSKHVTVLCVLQFPSAMPLKHFLFLKLLLRYLLSNCKG